MTNADMERVQAYLRRLLGTERIRVVPPARPGFSVEIAVANGGESEVIGTLHKDTEDGETSYSAHLTILEEDLPQLAKAPAKAGAGAGAKPARRE